MHASNVIWDIQGLPSSLEFMMRKQPFLMNLSQPQGLSTAQWFKKVEQSLKSWEKSLEAFGYYHAKVSAQLSPQQPHTQDLHIQVKVQLGAPTYIAHIALQVLDPPKIWTTSLEKLLAQPPLRIGQILNHAQYEHYKRQIVEVAHQEGFFEARWIEHRIAVDWVKKTADIFLTLQLGEPYTFGPIQWEAQGYSPLLLKKLFFIEAGDRYSSSELLRQQNSLIKTDYFKSVEILEDTFDPETRSVPLFFQLKPAEKKSLRLGLGYSPNGDFRLLLHQKIRHLNMAGDQVSLQLHFSRHLTKLETRLHPGQGAPFLDKQYYYAGYALDSVRVTQPKNTQFYVGFTQAIGDLERDWSFSYHLRYQYERYLDVEVWSQAYLLRWDLKFEKTWANHPNQPDQGYRAVMQTTIAQPLQRARPIVQLYCSLKNIQTPVENFRVISRLEMGTFFSKSLHEVPFSLRFFAGGDHSIRGYTSRSIGTTAYDENGVKYILGGTQVITASLEIDYKVLEDWRLALFFDIGDAFVPGTESFKTGYGVGLRWITRFGPIRLDYAIANQKNDLNQHLYLSLGLEL